MRKTKQHFLFISYSLLVYAQVWGQAKSTLGVFKDWTNTETRVLGMVQLKDTVGREFDRISAVDSNTVKVEEFNPAGTLTSTTLVHFLNKYISAIEEINQWGLLYKTTLFRKDTTDVMIVTEKQLGKNNYLPCKEAKYIYKNDLPVEVQYVSFSGRPCDNKYGVAYIKYTYFEDSDRYGRIKEMSFFDEDGLPTSSKAADYHKVVYDRDKHGNLILTEWYNETDHKLQNRVGVVSVKQVFDTSDNRIEEIYQGFYGEVKKNLYGVAKMVFTYQNGLNTATIFYDENDNIVKTTDTGSGIAMRLYEYNDKGFMTSETVFNQEERPANDHNGVHKRIYKYNTRNMLVEEAYFDKTSAPAVDKENIHRYVYGRDDKGRKVEMSFFGIANQPVKNRVERVCMIKFDYDSNNLLQSQSYWKEENTKMKDWGGVQTSLFNYNELGQQTEITNYDENGQLFMDSSGWSRFVKKYDSNARICEYSRFNGNVPTVTVKSKIRNYHSIKLVYDEKSRIAEIEYLDTNEKQVNAQIDLLGGFECYKIELKYVANKLTEEQFYILKASYPIKTIDCLKYDFVDPYGIIFGHKNRN